MGMMMKYFKAGKDVMNQLGSGELKAFIING